MNTTYLKTLFLVFFIGLGLLVKAQVYPVQVSQSIVPPYDTKLNSYATSTNVKLRLFLTLTDVNVGSRQVRLKLNIQGQGLHVRSTDFVAGAAPVHLSGGAQQRFTNIDLSPYFRLHNLMGIDPQQYDRPLPDGTYRICWEIYDFLTGQRISSPDMGCSTIFLVLNDPPLLYRPDRGGQLADMRPTNIIFQWTPRHANATNVSYEFELREVWDGQMDPQAGFLAAPPYHTETTYSTTLLYNMGKPQLFPGRTYAWRVRAKSTAGLGENSVFKNNGHSEIFHFRLTKDCGAPKFALSEAIGKGSVKISWQGGPGHNRYRVQYRRVGHARETDKQRQRRERKNQRRAERGREAVGYVPKKADHEWFEVNTPNEQARISNLEAGQTYEFRVGGTCSPLAAPQQYYTFTNENEFTMPTEGETVSYNCGMVPDIQITNQTPLQNIGINETFTAGDFPVTVKEIRNKGDRFTGTGYIVVPYLADTKIAVAFKGITINTDHQLIKGVVQTTYDPEWGNVVSVLVGGLEDSINNILDLLEEYTGSEEDIKALQEALIGLNTEIDNVQGNASIPEETKAPLSEALQESFNTSAENLTAQEDSPEPSTIEDNKDKLSQIKEAMTEISNSLNTGSVQGARIDDPTGFFDGYLPLKNNETAITIKKPDSQGSITIPIEATDENQTFYEVHPFDLDGTAYTLIYTSSITNEEDIEKARAKASTPENGVVIYYHYDTGNNRLGYKVEVDRDYFGNDMSDEDFEFSKRTLKEGLNNLIAELKAVDDWSAEIFEITVGLNNRIKQLLDSLELPEELWNPDNSNYNGIPFHFDPLTAGLLDGVIEEAKSVPLLINLIIDYSTSSKTREEIDGYINDLDFTEEMNRWYENEKHQYTTGTISQIEHRTGKHIVGVASILTGAGAALKGIKKGVDLVKELTGRVKKVRKKAIKNLDDFSKLSKVKKIEYIKKAWKEQYPKIFFERKLFEDIMGHYRYKKNDGWGHTADIAHNFKAIDFYKSFTKVGDDIFAKTAVSMKTTTTTNVDNWLASNPLKKNLDNLEDGMINSQGITWNGTDIRYNEVEVHIYMPNNNITNELKQTWLQKLSSERPDIRFNINSLEDFIE